MSRDAFSRCDPGLGRPLAAGELARLTQALVVAAVVLMAAAGGLIALRRAAGALAEPLPSSVLVLLGIVLPCLGLAFRRGVAHLELSPASRLALWAAPSAMLVLWTAAVSLPGSAAWGLVLLFGPALAEEGWSWGRWRGRFDGPPKTPHERGAPAEVPRADREPAPGNGCEAVTDQDIDDETVTQRMTRRRSALGDESIEGWVRVDFAAGQRHAAAHLAICPPLVRAPQCYVDQAGGADAQIKVAQVLAHGVRLELKLDELPAAPESVVVEFSIQPAADRDLTAD